MRPGVPCTVLALLMISPWSTAATITVCPTGCDESTVHEGVAAASPGDTVFIHPGAYVDPAAVVLDKSITIRGSGPDQTIIRGQNLDSVFRIRSLPPDNTATIEDLAIEYGRASGYGGAIEIDVPSHHEIFIRNCSIRSNYAASGGGAISVAGDVQGVSLEIESTEMYQNFSGSDGGAILFLAHESTLTLRSSRLVFNYTGSYGGGISFNLGDLVVESTEFRSNFNYYLGGALVLYGATARIQDSLFVDSSADRGGAIALFNSDLSLINTTIAMNTATDGEGGGILNNGNLEVSFSTIAGNTSSTGAGMGIQNNQTASLTASIISNPGGDNCGGLFESGDYNIDDDDSCGLRGVGDIVGQAAGIGPFIDTGDRHSHYPLFSASPAVDHAETQVFPDFDQLGDPRPQDGNGDGDAVSNSGAIEGVEGIFTDDLETGDTSAWSLTGP